jgi:hypothetical protein
MTTATPCRFCHARVYWLEHETSRKRAPIDVRPSPRGSALINRQLGTYAIVPEAERAGLADLYIVHFATCMSSPTRKPTGRLRMVEA